MSEVEERWWRNPTGIIAAVTIATLILGFFYTRERQLWEDKMAISSLEDRGAAAILKVETRAGEDPGAARRDAAQPLGTGACQPQEG